MPDTSSLEFYKAYTVNVNDFLIAESEIRRTLNRALKSNKQITIKVQTKVYALLYCTYSEANFMKLILTPYGFSQDFINQIIGQDNVQEKWLKCLELAFLEYTRKRKGSDVPNKILGLKKIITEFIVEPSIMRNKIAHGQLTIALNRKNTAINHIETQKIEELDFVKIHRLFEINKRLTSIIEDLIESPDKAHHHYYSPKFQELESFIKKTSTWTSVSKSQTHSLKKPILYK